MVSIVGICNMALDHIGDYRIESLGDNSQPARLCNRNYELARDEVLSEYGWGFAKRRQELAQLATDPVFEWDNAFQLPSDFIRPLKINGDDVTRYEWEIEGDQFLTSLATVKLVYVARVTDTSKFPPYFVRALAKLLAHKIAFPITNSMSARDRLLEEYERIDLRKAMAADRQGSTADRAYTSEQMDNSQFLGARNGG